MNSGDEAQLRLMAETYADAAIIKFASQHPEIGRSEIPPTLKWAGGIVAAVMTACSVAFLIWMASTLTSVSDTLSRMDERMKGQVQFQDVRYEGIERRVTELEGYHAGGRQ